MFSGAGPCIGVIGHGTGGHRVYSTLSQTNMETHLNIRKCEAGNALTTYCISFKALLV